MMIIGFLDSNYPTDIEASLYLNGIEIPREVNLSKVLQNNSNFGNLKFVLDLVFEDLQIPVYYGNDKVCSFSKPIIDANTGRPASSGLRNNLNEPGNAESMHENRVVFSNVKINTGVTSTSARDQSHRAFRFKISCVTESMKSL